MPLGSCSGCMEPEKITTTQGTYVFGSGAPAQPPPRKGQGSIFGDWITNLPTRVGAGSPIHSHPQCIHLHLARSTKTKDRCRIIIASCWVTPMQDLFYVKKENRTITGTILLQPLHVFWQYKNRIPLSQVHHRKVKGEV